MKIPENLTWLWKKIQETEQALKKTEIGIATSDSYLRLLEVHTELWKLLYFKLYQEEGYLLK